MEENPFKELKISSTEALDNIEGRAKCPKCNKSMKYYCYVCGIRVWGDEAGIPSIKLPVKVDIIRHKVEETGRNTAVHACILAPDDVTMYTWPDFPDYEDKSKVIVVFPGDDSVTLAELAKSVVDQRYAIPPDVTTADGDKTEQGTTTADFGDNGKIERQLKTDEASAADNKTADRSTSSEENEKFNIEKFELQSDPSASEKVSKDVFIKTASSVLDSLPSKCAESAERASDGSGTNCDIGVSKKHDLSPDRNEPKPKIKKIDRPVPPFNRVIFADATWHYVKRIGKDERLKGMKQVILKTEMTKFWRYQTGKPDTYLSTIEAIYYFFREFHDLFTNEEYDGRYDDLLFLFLLTYQRIRRETGGGEILKAFKPKNEGESKKKKKKSFSCGSNTAS